MRQSLPVPTQPVTNNDPHGLTSAALLILAGIWMAGMAFALADLAESWKFARVLFGFATVLVLLALTAWTSKPDWDNLGRIGLWFVLGLTLALWMIGILSFGWLIFPALILEVFALISWPRPQGESVATTGGIVAQLLGFLMIPAIFFSAMLLGF